MENKLTYQRLMLLPSEQLTDEQKTFLALHTEMVLAGQKAAECMLIVATDLKRMCDEELYKAAGFEKFSDYVENALNVKERQAFTWISILKLPEEYLNKNAEMGVTKLAAIASASEPVAAEIMEDETTASKSSRELKAIIKAKEKELAEKEKQVSGLESDLRIKSDRISVLENEVDELSNCVSDVDIAEYENKISELTAKIEELNNKAPEVITETIEKTVEVENHETQKALEEARAAAEAARTEKEEYAEQAERYQEELTAYKKTQEAVATFKIHAGSLFEMWERVLEAVGAIKAANTELAGKCLTKLTEFSETIQSDIEGLRQ